VCCFDSSGLQAEQAADLDNGNFHVWSDLVRDPQTNLWLVSVTVALRLTGQIIIGGRGD
jgi:hypothetical protein